MGTEKELARMYYILMQEWDAGMPIPLPIKRMMVARGYLTELRDQRVFLRGPNKPPYWKAKRVKQ